MRYNFEKQRIGPYTLHEITFTPGTDPTDRRPIRRVRIERDGEYVWSFSSWSAAAAWCTRQLETDPQQFP